MIRSRSDADHGHMRHEPMPPCANCGHAWGDYARPGHIDADIDTGERWCFVLTDIGECRCKNYIDGRRMIRSRAESDRVHGQQTKRFDWADTLALHIRAHPEIPTPSREFHFALLRQWRFDLCWPELKLFIECDGGEFTVGRHSRAAGMQADCRKWNAARRLGWSGLRFTGSMVRNGEAIAELLETFKGG